MNSEVPNEVPGSETTQVQLRRWTAATGLTQTQDYLAEEEPLEIRVQGRCLAVTMRTPGADAALAAGFLIGEGLLRERADLLEIAHCRQGSVENANNVLNVFLRPGLDVDFEKLTRHVFASSSCGVCGKASIDSVHQNFAPVQSAIGVRARMLLDLPDRLRARQRTFAQTGGLHAAAIFDLDGRILLLEEDVGRHNAVDKVIGLGFLNGGFPFPAHMLMVSGRASFEIVQKALAARIPIVAAISAPSSLAVEFARESGQTLVGFIRDGSLNVYAGHERVLD